MNRDYYDEEEVAGGLTEEELAEWEDGVEDSQVDLDDDGHYDDDPNVYDGTYSEE